jgi:hypothetical protein
LRSLQEIQPDFEEEAKAYAGLWSQGKKKEEEYTLAWRPEETFETLVIPTSSSPRMLEMGANKFG